MTLELPCSTITLFMTAPMTIRANPAHAHLGVARRQPNKTEEQKYRIAISKKIIQKINTLMPCAVSAM